MISLSIIDFLESEAAARPSITAMNIICSISDFWKGVITSLGTIFTNVSFIDMVAPSPFAIVSVAASASTAVISSGFPIGKIL